MLLKQRRRVQGYTDLGRIRIPPLPQYTIMTDRADGTKWLLQWNTTHFSIDGNGYISITTVLPSTPDKLIYGPYEGPFVQEQNAAQGNPVLRLLIRGGRLGYESLQDQGVQSIDNPRVLTRRVGSNTLREVVVPLVWKYARQPLGWRLV